MHSIRRRLFAAGSTLALALLFSGCAATKITSSWKAPAYTGPIHKVLVLGVAKKGNIRKAFESAFVNRLQNWGVEAVPGFAVLPGPDASQEQLRTKGRELGVDAVLVTKWIDLHKEKQEVTDVDYDQGFGPPGYPYYVRGYPGYYHRYYDDWYYDYAHSFATVRRYQVEYKVLDLETNLYDFASGELVWTATSRTTTTEALQSKVADIVQALIKELRREGLL